MSATIDVERVVQRAKDLGQTFAIAESLTGGMVCDRIVSVAGSSQVFIGGIVSYHTELKHTLLQVSAEVLREHGPVDQRVAEQMAIGVRHACVTHRSGEHHRTQPDIGVAVTGVAGPESDAVSGQLPGTVWVAVSSARGERSEIFHFTGDRAAVRNQATDAVLAILDAELEFFVSARQG